MTLRVEMIRAAGLCGAMSLVLVMGCGGDDPASGGGTAGGGAAGGGTAGGGGTSTIGGSGGGGAVTCSPGVRSSLTEPIAFSPLLEVEAGKGDSSPTAGVLLGDEIVFATEKLWALPKTGGTPRVIAQLPDGAGSEIYAFGADQLVLPSNALDAIYLVSLTGAVQTLAPLGAKLPVPAKPGFDPFAGVHEGALLGLAVIPKDGDTPARVAAISRDLATDVESEIGHAPAGYRCRGPVRSGAVMVALCFPEGSSCSVGGGDCKLARFSSKDADAELFDTSAEQANPELIGVVGNEAIVIGLPAVGEQGPLLAIPLSVGGTPRELARYTREQFQPAGKALVLPGGLLADGTKDLFVPANGGAIVETAIFEGGGIPQFALSSLLGSDGCTIYRAQITTSPTLTYRIVSATLGSK